MPQLKLLTSNAKLDKASPEYLNLGLALAPYNFAGGPNLCPWAGACAKTCIWKSGLNAFPTAIESKIKKTRFFLENPKQFIIQLKAEIARAAKRATKLNKKLAVRLNLYSDILWERRFPELFSEFPTVQFYDYTKAPLHVRAKLPINYHLTYSLSERTPSGELELALSQGRNVAAVFSDQTLPETFMGYRVIDGDAHDLRFTDPVGVIVGLRPKGSLRASDSDFKQVA